MVIIHVLQTYLRRRYIWIAPCKRSAARGWRISTTSANSVGVQPATGLKGRGNAFLPRAALRLHGYPYLSPIGDGKEQPYVKITLTLVNNYGTKSIYQFFRNRACQQRL